MSLRDRIEALEGQRAQKLLHVPLVDISDDGQLPGQHDGESIEDACKRLGYSLESVRQRKRLVDIGG